jgi:hypothetical protein
MKGVLSLTGIIVVLIGDNCYHFVSAARPAVGARANVTDTKVGAQGGESNSLLEVGREKPTADADTQDASGAFIPDTSGRPTEKALGATRAIKRLVKEVGASAETAGARALRVQERMAHYNQGLKTLKKYLGKVSDSQYRYAMNIIDHFKEKEKDRLDPFSSESLRDAMKDVSFEMKPPATADAVADEGTADGAQEATAEAAEGTAEAADGTAEVAEGTAEVGGGTAEGVDERAEGGSAEEIAGTEEVGGGTGEATGA